jgi:hypothetical protein
MHPGRAEFTRRTQRSDLANGTRRRFEAPRRHLPLLRQFVRALPAMPSARLRECEEEEFITSGNRRGKHKWLEVEHEGSVGRGSSQFQITRRRHVGTRHACRLPSAWGREWCMLCLRSMPSINDTRDRTRLQTGATIIHDRYGMRSHHRRSIPVSSAVM